MKLQLVFNLGIGPQHTLSNGRRVCTVILCCARIVWRSRMKYVYIYSSVYDQGGKVHIMFHNVHWISPRPVTVHWPPIYFFSVHKKNNRNQFLIKFTYSRRPNPSLCPRVPQCTKVIIINGLLHGKSSKRWSRPMAVILIMKIRRRAYSLHAFIIAYVLRLPSSAYEWWAFIKITAEKWTVYAQYNLVTFERLIRLTAVLLW